ncbi:CST complex subunit TEN1 [Amia ocellicauda]|uniref:CST complex subunit TEN1 n=1 Tax=Amia ocellicauda TaxID=2972642 RepID=UPI0034640503|nr:TEN1L protein [Amia calva]
MLPAPGVFHFPWEIRSGEVQEGATVRTFGRLQSYSAELSEAVLATQHGPTQHQLTIHTGFVEPFAALTGAQYLVLGELESRDGGAVAVRARILSCVDGANMAMLQRAIAEQRSYFLERERAGGQGKPSPDTEQQPQP